jgi:hypothetical protein
MTGDTIGYARTGSGREIDFGPVAVPGPGGSQWTTPVEVKWATDGWRAEARTIEGRYHAGTVATKTVTRLHTSQPRKLGCPFRVGTPRACGAAEPQARSAIREDRWVEIG